MAFQLGWPCHTVVSPSYPLTRESLDPSAARRDAIRVEDGVDVAERRQQAAQLFHVPHLDRVPVAGHLVGDVAAVLDDVRAVLGEGAGDVLEQARAIPRLERDR